MTLSSRAHARLLTLVLLLAGPSAGAQEKPLPLDPLTPQEREIAASAVRGDRRVTDLLGAQRSRQILVDFISVKRIAETAAQKDQPSHRYAEVLFYRYDGDFGVKSLVDLDTRSVLDVVRVDGRSVPIAAEEIQEAARLALADERVVRLFGGTMPAFRVATQPASREELTGDRIEGLRTLGASPSDPCYRHRCIVLFFRTNNRYVHMNEVVVDLSSQRVLLRGGGR
jgi:hypothetical protein